MTASIMPTNPPGAFFEPFFLYHRANPNTTEHSKMHTMNNSITFFVMLMSKGRSPASVTIFPSWSPSSAMW